MTVLGLLGIIFSGSVIYILALRRIRLSNNQNLLIINVAVSDVLVSIIGVFRGLGIIDSKFVGAPNGTSTEYCAVYTILLNGLGGSGAMALLPLTIDRAIAVMMPLQHRSIMTGKACAVMFGLTWFNPFLLGIFV